MSTTHAPALPPHLPHHQLYQQQNGQAQAQAQQQQMVQAQFQQPQQMMHHPPPPLALPPHHHLHMGTNNTANGSQNLPLPPMANPPTTMSMSMLPGMIGHLMPPMMGFPHQQQNGGNMHYAHHQLSNNSNQSTSNNNSSHHHHPSLSPSATPSVGMLTPTSGPSSAPSTNPPSPAKQPLYFAAPVHSHSEEPLPTQNSLPKKKPASIKPKKYACQVENCNKTYNRPCLLDQHMRSHSGERPYKCDICGKNFLRNSHLKTHKLSHRTEDDKPLRCEHCNKGFNTNQHLTRHVRTHYETHKCDMCDAKFKKHTQLRRHKTQNHSTTRKYICEHAGCSREFNHQKRLESHVLKNHSELPSYLCGEIGCGVACFTWGELQKHIAESHPKVVPCTLCDKKFAHQTGLAQHMRAEHEEASPMTREWQCAEPECMIIFGSRDILMSHYRTAHGFIPEALKQTPQEQQPPTSTNSYHSVMSHDASYGGIHFAHPQNPYHHLPPVSAPTSTHPSSHEVTPASTAGSTPVGTPHAEPPHYDGSAAEDAARRLTKAPTMIQRITGAGYNDTGRHIECIVPGCLYRFARQYDLNRHVSAMHPEAAGSLKDDYLDHHHHQNPAQTQQQPDVSQLEQNGFALVDNTSSTTNPPHIMVMQSH
ncbi:hypothetical protein TRVA0_062S00430 [Trichomonascus vanleenenianus]|uniref:Pzf1p n=1 Tax=Trichomonascus vanleenenianus TaxID=2268995 RepID=UPI003ECBA6E0